MDLILWWKKEEAPYYETDRRWRFPEFPADRTIRIRFSNKSWTPAFESKSYERYGTVRLRRYDNEDNHLRCLIEFDDRAVVDKIRSDGCIYINDQRINIDAMSVCDSDLATMMNDLIVKPLDDTSIDSFNLIGLNDDCLRFIFRKVHLGTLWSLANTSRRFNDIAKETFRLKCKQIEFRFCDVFTTYPISLQQIENVLKIFGSSIHKLCIGPHEFNYFDEYRLNDVLLLIGGNCPNLKVMDMGKLVVNHTIWNECLPLFPQLESLTLTFADNGMNYVRPTRLPKLQSFKITSKHFEHMESFLLNDWPLEELSVRSLFNAQEVAQNISQETRADWSIFFGLICERCASVKKLTKLPIVCRHDENFNSNLMRLSELKCIRHLRLNFNNLTDSADSVQSLLQEMHQNDIQLEYLRIRDGDIRDDAIDVISQFRNITTLTFSPYCDYTSNGLIRLAKELPLLSTLRISTYDLMVESVDDHIDLIKPIVANGKHFSHLIVDIFSGGLPICGDQKYDELLAIVQKRVIPIKLTVTFCSKWYGPHTVTHIGEMKSNPNLLVIETIY